MIISSVHYKEFVWDNVIPLGSWLPRYPLELSFVLIIALIISAAENLQKKNEVVSGGRKLTSLSDSTDTENEVANVPSSSMLDHKVRFILI
jgi:hypothetical protein